MIFCDSLKETKVQPFIIFFIYVLSIEVFAELVPEGSPESGAVPKQVIVVSAKALDFQSKGQNVSYKKIDIKKQNLEIKPTVVDVLRVEPGLEVFNQGGPGKVSKLFLRGTNSEHTLVLIDGIEVNDSSSPGRAFDFAHTDLNNIESIEVIKGPQSVAYGSDALGGVIHIKTMEGKGKFQPRLLTEVGSFGSRKLSVGALQGDSKNKYSVLLSYRQADGFSSANEKDGNHEKDGYEQIDFSSKWNSRLSESISSEVVVKFVDAKNELDRNGGSGADDPNSEEGARQFFAKLELSTFFWSDQLESKILLNYSKTHRKNKNLPDPISSLFQDDFFQGEGVKLQWLNNYSRNPSLFLQWGGDYELEEVSSNQFSSRKARSFAGFFQVKKQWNSLYSSLGLRYGRQIEGSAQAITYQSELGYNFVSSGTKISASLSSGFKNPSLSQLYHPTTGKTTLDPEEVVGWEVGVEQSLWENHVESRWVYFDNDFKNLISFDSMTTKSINLGESRIRGLEWSHQFFYNKETYFSWAYSHFFEIKNTANNTKLIRRPRNTWKGTIASKWKRVGVQINYRYVGQRDDFQAVDFQKVQAPSYEVFDLSLDYKLKGGSQFYMRFNNLLNTNYEEVDGFGTPGFSVFSGVQWVM